MIKISFVGDIMFERQFLKASKQTDGTYCFSELFEDIKNKFAQSDYVVANLESVFGGGNMKYTDSLYSFNTPDEALDALASSGISMVSTANNHCLDRGIEGLLRTIKVLNDKGIEFTGTYLNPQEKSRSLIKEIEGVKFGFMSYTYGTNTLENKIVLDSNKLGHINLLTSQTSNRLTQEGRQVSPLRRCVNSVVQKLFSSNMRMLIKRLLGMPLNTPIVDDNIFIDDRFIQKLIDDIKSTKAESDVVFMLMHSGGQFNSKPGAFTRKIVRILLDNGVDYIIGTHPHVVQQMEASNDNVVFYSLGNFSISPSSVYILHDLKPEYSIVPHFYFDNEGSRVSLVHLTFSILKIIENANHKLKVYTVSDLYEQLDDNGRRNLRSDVSFIYNRLIPEMNGKGVDVNDEYKIF